MQFGGVPVAGHSSTVSVLPGVYDMAGRVTLDGIEISICGTAAIRTALTALSDGLIASVAVFSAAANRFFSLVISPV